MTSNKNKSILDRIQPFVIGHVSSLGGLSGCFSTCLIQPIDMVKVTIQIKNQQIALKKLEHLNIAGETVSPFSVVKQLYHHGGIKYFYKGLDSALTRQIFYTTSRLGIYKSMFEYTKKQNKSDNVTFFQKLYCSLFAGFIGSLIGTPADLALIRVQSDQRQPPNKRRNYKNVFDAFRTIVREEGIFGLWRGCTPTVIRAIFLNLAMLASYDEVKDQLNKYSTQKDSVSVRMIASAVSGVLSSTCSLPFDNAKTKMQKMVKNQKGVFQYRNIFDAMFQTVRKEGVLGLWVGLPTFYIRIAPHVMIVKKEQSDINFARFPN